MNRFNRLVIVIGLLAGVAIPASAAVHVVPSPETPTIASALAAAAYTDTVDVLPGTYYEHDLLMEAGVTLRGVAGPSETIIDAEGQGRVIATGFVVGAAFEGLTLTNGAADNGAAIHADLAEVVVRDCIITNNHATGGGGGIVAGAGIGQAPLSIFDSVLSGNSANQGGALWTNGVSLAVERCIFRDNIGDGGAGLLGKTTGHVSECLFTDNSDGLSFVLSTLSVSDCTFVGNVGPPGGAIRNAFGEIVRSIFAYNTSAPAVICATGIPISCSNFFGNGSDALCGTDAGGNFSLDPLFCDRDGGDLQLHEDSPCLPGQHPMGTDCEGTIGALGVGCGEGTPVGEGVTTSSWSRIKTEFR